MENGIKEVYNYVKSSKELPNTGDSKTFQQSVKISLEPTQETIDFYHQMYSVNMRGLSKHSLVREMIRNLYS